MDKKWGTKSTRTKILRTRTFYFTAKSSVYNTTWCKLHFSITFVEVLRQLAGVAAAIGAALFHGRTLSILLTALHAGCCEAAGLLWGRTVALLHSLYWLQELTARKTLVVLLGKEGLSRRGRRRGKMYVRLLFKTDLHGCKQAPLWANRDCPVYISAHESLEQQVH